MLRIGKREGIENVPLNPVVLGVRVGPVDAIYEGVPEAAADVVLRKPPASNSCAGALRVLTRDDLSVIIASTTGIFKYV